MTTWTEQTSASATYEQDIDGAIWDAGATVWDRPGTVALTYWDVSADTAWTDAAATSTTWTNA